MKARIESIDLARGIAVALMILSHGVKGLLPFERFPSWGLVPIHLVTKFSSSLFILVFGISLAVVHLPAVDTPAWPAKRRKLLHRGLVVFLWYKAMTVVEMMHLHTRAEIADALLYRAFPVYVEILGFYAIALLWIPFVLPAWARAASWQRILCLVSLTALAAWLQRNFSFGGSDVLKAILVEHERHYTWGQLSRAPLVFLGVLLGERLHASRGRPGGQIRVAGALAALSLALFLLFLWKSAPMIGESLREVSMNEGEHPPEPGFMLFSVGGAALILSLAILGGGRLASALRPITLIGTDALQSFVFHIFVLFVLYRYLFGYWHSVSYPYALFLAVLLVALTAVWIRVLRFFQGKS